MASPRIHKVGSRLMKMTKKMQMLLNAFKIAGKRVAKSGALITSIQWMINSYRVI